MKIYYINDAVYMDIWLKLGENGDRGIDHIVVDRWLSIYHGLTAISDEVDEHDCYPFMIRDEEKFILSLLRWS